MKRPIVLLIILCLCLSGCGISVSPSSTPTTTDTPVIQEIVEETPAPADQEEIIIADVTPEPVPVDPYSLDGKTFAVACNFTPYYSTPTSDLSAKIGELSLGTTVTYITEYGDYYQVQLDNETQVWVDKWFLNATDSALRQHIEIENLSALSSSPTFVPTQTQSLYTVTCTNLNCRAVPANNCKIYTQIYYGDQVTVLGQDGDFYLCKLRSGGLAYCSAYYLTSEPLYAVMDGAVDLRAYLPNAEFEILFASSNNVTGSAMYPAIPLLESHTAELLKKAYDIFAADGYTLKIYDAYRPKSAQIKLWDIVQDTRFIADPYHGLSWHQQGRAVDISLVDTATGIELEMPTPMHTFDMAAARSSSTKWSEEVRNNVDYMTRVMQSVGFGTITTEWWHFEYTGGGATLNSEIDYSQLKLVPASEYELYKK